MAVEKQIKITADTKESEDKVDRLIKAFEKMSDNIEKSNDKLDDTSKGLKDVDKSATKAKGGIKGVVKTTKALGTAFKAIGIGLIVALVAKLTESFSKNQKVVDSVSAVFETIGVVFNQVFEALTNVYNSVKQNGEGFDALSKVISGLITIALTPLKLTFFGIKLAIQEAQLLWEKSFFGDKDPTTIKELTEGIEETKTAIVEVGEEAIEAGKKVIVNFGEAVSEAAEIGSKAVEELSKISVKAAFEQSKSLVEQRKQVELLLAQNELVLKTKQKEAELLRQTRDDVRKPIEERIKANNDLLKTLEESNKIQEANAKRAVDLAKLELSRDKNNVELKKAVIAAELNYQDVLETTAGFVSEQKTNEAGLELELIALNKTKTDGIIEREKTEKEFAESREKNELTRIELEKQRLLDEQQKLIDDLEFKKGLYAEGTQARADAEEEYLNRDQEIKNQLVENERLTNEEKLKIRNKALDDLTSIANSESKIGKALLVAKQAILAKELILEASKTITFSAQAAARSTVAVAEGTAQTAKVGFPQNIPLLIGYAAQAAGIISAITSATRNAGAAGAISTPSAPTATAPSFNLVQGTGSNQIAESLQTGQEPVKAYVVSSEVTTSQSLDRNIEGNASI